VSCRLRRLLVLIAIALPSPAHADEPRWGVSIWGLSYHVNRSVDYNEDNWGLGVRYYFKPNRLFLEADALRNSEPAAMVRRLCIEPSPRFSCGVTKNSPLRQPA